jgi:hypothetical protein
MSARQIVQRVCAELSHRLTGSIPSSYFTTLSQAARMVKSVFEQEPLRRESSNTTNFASACRKTLVRETKLPAGRTLSQDFASKA